MKIVTYENEQLQCNHVDCKGDVGVYAIFDQNALCALVARCIQQDFDFNKAFSVAIEHNETSNMVRAVVMPK